jgi:hypothetical protein
MPQKRPRRFAEGTKVPAERTKAEIERLLDNHHAEQYGVFSDREKGVSVVTFKLGGRLLKFDVWHPDPAASEQTAAGNWRSVEQLRHAVAAEERRLWRSLLLRIKAKLEAIASGDTTIDDEFLAYVVLPDGRTMMEAMAPKLDAAYASGQMPELSFLPAKGETGR